LTDYLLMVFLGFVGILCPIFNTEVSFLAMSYKVQSTLLLSVAAGAGSTGGFVVFYFVGAGSRNLSRRLREKVAAIDVDRFSRSGILVTASSCLASIPPCTPLSIAAGTLRYSLGRFTAVLLVFRSLKYWVIGCFYEQIHAALLQGLAALERVAAPLVESLKGLL